MLRELIELESYRRMADRNGVDFVVCSSNAHSRPMRVEEDRALHVWREALPDGYDGASVYLEPSSPMRQSGDIVACLERAYSEGGMSFTAHETKLVQFDDKHPRRGLQPNGACYAIMDSSELWDRESIWQKPIVACETPWRLNIDTESQMEVARRALAEDLPHSHAGITVTIQ